MYKPISITLNEWQELISLRQVINAWDLDETTTAESFSSFLFGVKFNFTLKPPDELGDLYILTDGVAQGQSMMIRRIGADLFVDE